MNKIAILFVVLAIAGTAIGIAGANIDQAHPVCTTTYRAYPVAMSSTGIPCSEALAGGCPVVPLWETCHFG